MKTGLAKVLHQVLDKPMLRHIIDNLIDLKINEAYIIVGHNQEQIVNYLNDNKLDQNFKTIVQDPPLGSGHALMQAIDHLNDYPGDVLVLNGDMPLIQFETLSNLVKTHNSCCNDITILTASLPNPTGFGRIIRDNDNIIGIIEEKDATGDQKNIQEINVGIYCFKWASIKNGLKNLQPNNAQGEYYLTDLIKYAYANKLKISSCSLSDFKEASGVNSRAELALANRHLSDINIARLLDSGVTIIDPKSTWISSNVKIGIDTIIMPNTYILGDVNIGGNCIIGPDSNITGVVNIGDNVEIKSSYLNNCNIGDACKIGPFANIRFNTILSPNVKIGNFVEIKASSIATHTNVSHLSYIGDTTIGKYSNVGAGTITANYNHMSKEKFKTVIGSNVAIGSNCVLVAPVTVGDNTILAAGSVITKMVPDCALAIARGKQTNKENYVKEKYAVKVEK